MDRFDEYQAFLSENHPRLLESFAPPSAWGDAIWEALLGDLPPAAPKHVRLRCPVCSDKDYDKPLSLSTTEDFLTLVHCFRGCPLPQIHMAAWHSEPQTEAEIRERKEEDRAEQKKKTDYLWDRTETVKEELAAHRYLTDRLGFSGKGWQGRHLEYLGRDIRAVRSAFLEPIHESKNGIKFLPSGWQIQGRTDGVKPYAVAYGYRPCQSEDPPSLIQLLPIDKKGRRHPSKRWRTALSRGRLAEHAVCEALNLGEPGPMVVAESPVTAIAAAFIYATAAEKPSYAIAAYGAAGLSHLNVPEIRGSLMGRDLIDITGLVIAVDGDDAGEDAALALCARGDPDVKLIESEEGRDAADDWRDYLRTGEQRWNIRETPYPP